MNKYVKGWLIGKSIEIVVASAAMLIAQKVGYLPHQSKEDFILQNRKKAARKRISH